MIYYLEYSRDIFGFCSYNITLGDRPNMKYFAVNINEKSLDMLVNFLKNFVKTLH